jgi:minor extracellular serine protease Vpr
MSNTLKRLFGSLLAFALVLSFVLPAAAQEGAQEVTPLTPAPSAETGVMTDETTNLWFVELASPPAAEGTTLTTLRNEKNAFRGNAQRAGLKYSERYAFDNLFNGFSIKIEKGELGKLSRIEGVKAIYPVIEVARPEPQSAIDPEMATALAMTGADTAQSELGLTGKGVRVAVMDTGIDYNHPDLGGNGIAGNKKDFPNSRVITGYDFVGDAFNARIPGSQPVPDNDPDDCGSAGHGTHVAGIVGASGDPAKGGVRGVAPEVTFGAYRVFGCEGSTTADIMIAAMDRALADRMHILNMSIGSAFMTWPQYPTAAAADRLVNRGMVVVASIGNSGANGLYSAGAPGVGNRVIGVASFDNSHISALTFQAAGRQIPYLHMSDSAVPPTSGTTPEIVHVGQGCNADAYLGNPGGKIALIKRGACTFNEKYQRAVAAGATGVVIYNNVAGIFAGGGISNRGVASVGISDTDGQAILAAMQNGPVTITWADQRVNAANPTGGLISSFSSYGMNAELTLKPDIGGPGGLIRATYPLEQGGYATISGTSMSSPHVAGSVALLLQAKPRTPAQTVRSILQNTAEPKPWSGNRNLGFLDHTFRQGAGMVQIDKAIQTTSRIEPGKLSLGESELGPRTETLTIENKGASAVTYDLSHAPALSAGGNTNGPSLFTGFASVAFSVPSITVPAGGTTTVDVTITANPSLADRSQYGGYIVFTPQDGGTKLRVPYAGFKGDYQSIQVLTATANQFPWLAKVVNGFYQRQADGASFNLTNGELPYFVAHFEHQSRRLRFEVIDAKTGQNLGRAVQQDFLPRNSTSTGVFGFAFDGTTIRGKQTLMVPAGEYRLQVSVLKALGDENNPDHWETWTSPVFTIQR